MAGSSKSRHRNAFSPTSSNVLTDRTPAGYCFRTSRVIRKRWFPTILFSFPFSNQSSTLFYSNMAKTHVVLVHGAAHQSWHYHLLAQKLEEAGYAVSTPQNPSASPDPTGPDCTLAGDTAAIKAALENAAAASDHVLA